MNFNQNGLLINEIRLFCIDNNIDVNNLILNPYYKKEYLTVIDKSETFFYIESIEEFKQIFS